MVDTIPPYIRPRNPACQGEYCLGQQHAFETSLKLSVSISFQHLLSAAGMTGRIRSYHSNIHLSLERQVE
jgi:hypothetical protein